MYFFLKEPKSQNDTIIYLIYYIKSEGRNFKYSTGQKINPKDWNFDARMPISKRGSLGVKLKHISSILIQYSDFLESTIRTFELNNELTSNELLKDKFNIHFKKKKVTRKSPYITDIIEVFIESRYNSLALSKTWKQKYFNIKNKILIYEQHINKKIKFSDIDNVFFDDLCGFLRKIDIPPFKPHNDNTLARFIGMVKTFLKWSYNDYHTLDLSKITNPVKSYQADDVYLTEKEIEKLENIELNNEKLSESRDMFLIGIYSGQRFSDYSVFEKADIINNMIIKKAEKTEYESYIPLHDKLNRLLEKYNWELPQISNYHFNKHIHKICQLANIDEEIKQTTYRGNEKEVTYKKKYEIISSHTARRTFITLSAERGMPDHVIMKITGIRKVETLLKYKKTSQQSIIDSMNKYWG